MANPYDLPITSPVTGDVSGATNHIHPSYDAARVLGARISEQLAAQA